MQPAARMAFGKIGGFSGGMGATRSISSVAQPMMAFLENGPSWAPGAPAAEGVANVVVDQSAPTAMMRPYPSTERLATVEYVVPETLPTWGEEGDVIRLGQTLPGLSTAGSFLEHAGLPHEVFGRASALGNVNVQWKDKEDLSWSYDAVSRSLNAWRDGAYTNQGSPLKTPPDRSVAIEVADAFLDRYGFGSIKSRGGRVEQAPWEMYAAGGGTSGVAYPCLMERTMEGGVVSTPPAVSTAPATPVAPSDVLIDAPEQVTMMEGQAGTAVSSMPAIWPGPCGWDGWQVTVTYPAARSGQEVVQLGGYPAFAGSVTVDLAQKRVMNASILLERPEERSAYPLIDAATALRRLQSGGLNPVWPYSESGSIKVTIKEVTLVWLRHETWKDGTSMTFELPALLGVGTIQRGATVEPGEYRTLVPLLTDDALDESIDMGGGGIPKPEPLPAIMMEKEAR